MICSGSGRPLVLYDARTQRSQKMEERIEMRSTTQVPPASEWHLRKPEGFLKRLRFFFLVFGFSLCNPEVHITPFTWIGFCLRKDRRASALSKTVRTSTCRRLHLIDLTNLATEPNTKPKCLILISKTVVNNSADWLICALSEYITEAIS